MGGEQRRDTIGGATPALSPPDASLYPREVLRDPRATPGRRLGGWLACLVARGGTVGCVGAFPPGWFYVTAVDRTGATVVWTAPAAGRALAAAATATPPRRRGRAMPTGSSRRD